MSQSNHLFSAKDEDGKDSNLHHLAEMVSVLEPPPTDFLRRSEFATEIFDDQGMPSSRGVAAFEGVVCKLIVQGRWENTVKIPPQT